MVDEYTETGGLRWGKSFWYASNFTWPFATLKASRDRLIIRVGIFKLYQKTFEFSRSEIKSIKRRRGLFSVGVMIEHSEEEYPPFILFWTFNFRNLRMRLNQLGYEIEDEGDLGT